MAILCLGCRPQLNSFGFNRWVRGMHNILIADDDEIMTRLMQLKMAEYADQFKVFFAQDGQEAIAILDREDISLLITDIEMPRMNGLVLLAYVHTYHPHLQCFVMTAYATARLREKVPKGVIRFFQKPLNYDNFVKAILAALERVEPPKTAEGISIVSFLEMIEMEKLTCKFEMEDPNQSVGAMFFENGILIDAVCNGIKGEAAALELIRRKVNAYRFKEIPDEHRVRKIKTELQDLIRNAVVYEPETELSIS